MKKEVSSIAKILEVAILILLIAAVAVKYVMGAEILYLAVLGGISLAIYIVLVVLARMPSTWRLNSSQKARIDDLQSYETGYNTFVLVLNVIMQVGMAMVILLAI